MMDLLPADDSDGDRWQDNLPDTDIELDIGGDENARLNLGNTSRALLPWKNSCLHESNKLSPDLQKCKSGKNIISNRQSENKWKKMGESGCWMQ